MTADRWQQVGVALRRARGTLDMTEAARRSGNSRQWWLEAEKGVRPPRPEKLARAVLAVGGDLDEVFELAGYDPAPFRTSGPTAGEPAPSQPSVEDLTALVRRQAEVLDEMMAKLTQVAELLGKGLRPEDGSTPPDAPRSS